MRIDRRLAALLVLVIAPLAGCLQGGGGSGGDTPACSCVGAVPEGSLDLACGESACVGGAGYRCTGPNTATGDAAACLPLRRADAPDVLVVSVSGHCFGGCPSEYHPEYLTRDGTSQAIADAFIRHGRPTAIVSFGDSFYSWEETATGTPLVYGFLDLVATLEEARDTMVVGFRNPTVVVVLAHSHGCVWAHTALHVLEQSGAPLPVGLLVDLDAIAGGWEDDTFTLFAGDYWMAVIDAYVMEHGNPWPFDIADVTESWAIPGLPGQDIVDVVPTSVGGNIEVWSASTFVSDRDPNHRLDGSQLDIATITSTAQHEDVDAPTSDAMRTIVAAIDDALEGT